MDILPKDMTLAEFISLPTTASFQVQDSDRFRQFAEENPYIRIGTVLSGGYVIAYVSEDKLHPILRELGETFINNHPIDYTLLDSETFEEPITTRLQQMPGVDLRGQGVILGFVDTGIDYTSASFRYEDGSSKILSIWDQTGNGTFPEDMQFGAVYTQKEINAALQSESPLEIVPQQDTIGHGTFIASVAGGRENNGHIGSAPDASIIAVKLKPASPYYFRLFPELPDDSIIFTSDNIMMGIEYILDQADTFNRPVAICIALGTNFGGHAGFSMMEEYLTYVCNRRGVAICTAAGNESNAKHHTDGVFTEAGQIQNIGINVGQNVRGFSVQIWNEAWDKISVAVKSPTGQVINRIPFESNIAFRKTLVLEKSLVGIGYFQLRSRLAIVEVEDPTPGIWEIILQGDIVVSGEYHAWLPITGMVSPYVEFIEPKPNYTIVNPATSIGTITCGAYNNRDDSLFIASSWGPTRLPRMSPDFVAPGVNIGGIYPKGPGTSSGTGVAAAITTGAAAIMLQWGIVMNHEPDMSCNRVLSLLIRGCSRSGSREYPNVQWGYGKLDLFESFNKLK
ncbi:S8 family peptidase [Sedimentibacter hydroxybenzoicus DSM 7310]|uniref:S8 family peptidase n=1 Tax=Sedimentibacter hydroxybenzoicus DSM 7310 TaxID=1123245 RepID=A0A974BN06_SEDHY|nr:S8 family peptidase [Sedimentibacter hydroxybenzoicus]NYB75896.1 S8 family peptidase [Sedimentibacter hydroxybenzoicus DSM 7310]